MVWVQTTPIEYLWGRCYGNWPIPDHGHCPPARGQDNIKSTWKPPHLETQPEGLQDWRHLINYQVMGFIKNFYHHWLFLIFFGGRAVNRAWNSTKGDFLSFGCRKITAQVSPSPNEQACYKINLSLLDLGLMNIINVRLQRTFLLTRWLHATCRTHVHDSSGTTGFFWHFELLIQHKLEWRTGIT